MFLGVTIRYRPEGVFDCMRNSWKPVATAEYVYGNFAWTGFDYKGETTLGWPDVNSHYGIHDLAGFAKDATGYYEAWWRDGVACEGVESGKGLGVLVSPSEWTAPVAVGTTVPVHVTTCAAVSYPPSFED